MKSARRRARELCLQGLYQWVVSGGETSTLLAQLAEVKDFAHADGEFLAALLRDTIAGVDALRLRIAPFLDRPIKELSPVEHALLLLSTCEIATRLETPYRVIINEAIELAKTYGGTDGHKYVNGVLDKLAAQVRPEEVAARRSAK
jgi:N utilization substance protein B